MKSVCLACQVTALGHPVTCSPVHFRSLQFEGFLGGRAQSKHPMHCTEHPCFRKGLYLGPLTCLKWTRVETHKAQTS